MNDHDNIRTSIIEFWKAVLLALLAFCVIVVYVFVSSALDWKHEQERLELLARQKAAEKVNRIGVYSFINTWEMADVGLRGTNQIRHASQLDFGTEYETGRLRYYDTRETPYGFDHVLEVSTDDPTYINPIITVKYAKFINVKYSIDCENSYILSSEVQRGLKTDELLYTLSADPESVDLKEGAWGKGAITFTVPINGINGLEVNIDSADISEDMRKYNYIITERLGDQYYNVPEKFADRTRKVYTSHVIIEGWSSDPREWKTNGSSKALTPRPEITVLVRIKYYGKWDMTEAEYESIRFSVSGFADMNNREFSPYTTIEYIGTPVSDTNAEK